VESSCIGSGAGGATDVEVGGGYISGWSKAHVVSYWDILMAIYSCYLKIE